MSPTEPAGALEGDSTDDSDREPPEIPDDAQEDVPFAGSPSSALVEVKDPDGEHRRKMDWSKLGFGKNLIYAAIAGIVALSLIQAYIPSAVEGQSLDSAIDTLKLITTIALGFVFGRAVGRSED